MLSSLTWKTDSGGLGPCGHALAEEGSSSIGDVNSSETPPPSENSEEEPGSEYDSCSARLS